MFQIPLSLALCNVTFENSIYVQSPIHTPTESLTFKHMFISFIFIVLIDTFGFDYAIYVMLYFLFVLFLSSVTSSFGFVLQYRASLYLRLPWNSPSSPCLSPSSAGITGVTHRTWLIAIFLFCYFFEMGPHCVDLAGLEHPVWLVMVLNS